jgi:hypothetical protein
MFLPLSGCVCVLTLLFLYDISHIGFWPTLTTLFQLNYPLFYFYYCCTGGTSWHLLKFLQYIIVEFTLSFILFYLPSPHSRNSFHTWVPSISTIFTLLHPFLISSPLPLVPTPRQDLFYLPVLRFCKNKMTFLFMKNYLLKHPTLFKYYHVLSPSLGLQYMTRAGHN